MVGQSRGNVSKVQVSVIDAPQRELVKKVELALSSFSHLLSSEPVFSRKLEDRDDWRRATRAIIGKLGQWISRESKRGCLVGIFRLLRHPNLAEKPHSVHLEESSRLECRLLGGKSNGLVRSGCSPSL